MTTPIKIVDISIIALFSRSQIRISTNLWTNRSTCWCSTSASITICNSITKCITSFCSIQISVIAYFRSKYFSISTNRTAHWLDSWIIHTSPPWFSSTCRRASIKTKHILIITRFRGSSNSISTNLSAYFWSCRWTTYALKTRSSSWAIRQASSCSNKISIITYLSRFVSAISTNRLTNGSCSYIC